MLIRIGYEMSFEVQAPTVFTFLLKVLPERVGDLELPDNLVTAPSVEIDHFMDTFNNRCMRLLSPTPSFRIKSESIILDPGTPSPSVPDAEECSLLELPSSCLQFLNPSRYCESDALASEAWRIFGEKERGWKLVQNICDWVHENIEFGYAYAHSQKTAKDVFVERRGVCRDLTHLAITFCRALNVPARYATGYLGDIGVPPADSAMDFSACFQVYLGNAWHLFDARHNTQRIGWVLLATGRDAADCAITTSYGPHVLQDFVVITEEIKSSIDKPSL